MRVLPRSLNARMLMLSAIATIAALAIAGVFIAGVLERFVVDGLDRRLDAEITLLATSVDRDGHVDRPLLQQRIGALENGRGWRWRIVGPDGAIGSSDFPVLDPRPPGPEDTPPGAAAPPPPRDSHRPQPREGHEGDTHVHARTLTIGTRRGDVTIVAAAPRDVVRRPIRGAMTPLLAALAGLGALLAGAMLVQLRVGLRPLRRLGDEVAAIRRGTLQRVSEHQPDELRPLAIELNALAADNKAALATARASSANLAHALKTPIATLAIDVRDNPALLAQVTRIDATIRHHLARARTRTANLRTTTPLAPALASVAAAVWRLHADRTIAIDIDLVDDVAVAIDPHDLDELLGNLLDNAARHATKRVSVTVSLEGRQVGVVIADDGPGIPVEDREKVTHPGTRLDEREDGYGFGLAIAVELVMNYGGTIALDDAPGGGLLVRLSLPAGTGQTTERATAERPGRGT